MVLELQVKLDETRVRALLAAGPGRLHQAVVRGMRRGSEVVVKRAKENLTANRSVAFGPLRASIWYALHEDTLTSVIGPLLRSKAGPGGEDPVNYGWFVEHGRRPGGLPPRGALRLWIRRKLGRDPDERVPATSGRGSYRLENLIRLKIGRRGTPANPFLEPALRDSAPTVQARMDAELTREVERLEGRA